eukprot:6177055-Pleurochrysis_carterae.AAC.4
MFPYGSKLILHKVYVCGSSGLLKMKLRAGCKQNMRKFQMDSDIFAILLWTRVALKNRFVSRVHVVNRLWYIVLPLAQSLTREGRRYQVVGEMS